MSRRKEMQPQRPNVFVLFFSALALLSITGCDTQRALDGSSREAFTSSVAAVARGLPESERSEFLDALTTLSIAEGSVSLEQPSLRALTVLHGLTPAMIQEQAQSLRRSQEQRILDTQLTSAERELKQLAEQLSFARGTSSSADRATTSLSNMIVSDAVATPENSVITDAMTLQFNVQNRNPVPAEVLGLELYVKHPSGPSKTYGRLAMMGMSKGCMFGQVIAAGKTVATSCWIQLRRDPDAEYTVRIAELKTSDAEAWLTGPLSAAQTREKEDQLRSAFEAKRLQVSELRQRLSSLR